MNHKFTYLC